jgi:hypothetical protein
MTGAKAFCSWIRAKAGEADLPLEGSVRGFATPGTEEMQFRGATCTDGRQSELASIGELLV